MNEARFSVSMVASNIERGFMMHGDGHRVSFELGINDLMRALTTLILT